MTETLFIINPVSGGGASLKAWRAARPVLLAAGLPIREHFTTCAGEAIEMTRAALRDGIRRIAAVGGDGTLSEGVNGYLDAGGRPINPEAAIAILPGGTGTDFCRTLGIASLEHAIRALLGSKMRMTDAGRITLHNGTGQRITRAFINLASFGLGGETAMFVNRWRGRGSHLLQGRALYVLAALRALDRYRNHRLHVEVEPGGEMEIESNLLVVANGKYAGGGMMLAPHAEVDDGWFDVVLANGATRLDIIRELPRIGRGGHLQNPKVSEQRTRAISIRAAEPLAVDVDGDFAGYTPARLEVLPSAIRFLVSD